MGRTDNQQQRKDIMKTERETIEAAQDALQTLKGELRNLKKINAASGNVDAVNEIMGALGELQAWHRDITRQMTRLWPDFASEIQVRGGGGR